MGGNSSREPLRETITVFPDDLPRLETLAQIDQEQLANEVRVIRGEDVEQHYMITTALASQVGELIGNAKDNMGVSVIALDAETKKVLETSRRLRIQPRPYAILQ